MSVRLPEFAEFVVHGAQARKAVEDAISMSAASQHAAESLFPWVPGVVSPMVERSEDGHDVVIGVWSKATLDDDSLRALGLLKAMDRPGGPHAGQALHLYVPLPEGNIAEACVKTGKAVSGRLRFGDALALALDAARTVRIPESGQGGESRPTFLRSVGGFVKEYPDAVFLRIPGKPGDALGPDPFPKLRPSLCKPTDFEASVFSLAESEFLASALGRDSAGRKPG